MAKSKVKYWLTDEGLLLIGAWARDGLTDEQIAHNMGIGYSTLQTWKGKHQDIQDTLKKNKAVVDYEVENALLKRALGYTYTETTSERQYNEDTEEYEMVVTKEVTKQVAPDTTAQIFWLKNRKPKDWRDTKDINVDGSLDTGAKALTDEELAERISKLKSKLGVSFE